MEDAALITFASEFRDGILDGAQSRWMCFAVCAPLSPLLRLHGVENEIVESDLGDFNHIWLRLEDGRALDPTADQFNVFPGHDWPPVYLGAPGVIHPAPRSSPKP